jgi:hypothetical protein
MQFQPTCNTSGLEIFAKLGSEYIYIQYSRVTFDIHLRHEGGGWAVRHVKHWLPHERGGSRVGDVFFRGESGAVVSLQDVVYRLRRLCVGPI